jgi:hypothetical protein
LPISDQACGTKRLLRVLDAVGLFLVVSLYVLAHQLIWHSNYFCTVTVIKFHMPVETQLFWAVLPGSCRERFSTPD